MDLSCTFTCVNSPSSLKSNTFSMVENLGMHANISTLTPSLQSHPNVICAECDFVF